MEVDFLDRTVLKIITDKGYEPLLRDFKVAALLEELWVGKQTYECDGRTADFSMLTFLFHSQIKKLPNQTIPIRALLDNNFKPDYMENSFTYQYRFRKSSISFIFIKECISTLFVCGYFMFVNY